MTPIGPRQSAFARLGWPSVAGATVVGVGLYLAANALADLAFVRFSGVCVAEKRFLSEAEIIDRVVDRQLASVAARPAGPDFKTKAEFYAYNPHCCSLFRLMPGISGEFGDERSIRNSHDSALQRLFRPYSIVVQFDYRAPTGKDGAPSGWATDVRVDGCGRRI